MNKILKSILVITIVLAFGVYATNAFFSDTETSTNNVLTAGAIDLKIDNDSYYNGIFNEDTSWDLDDLADRLFFNFNDLKPDDYGEDTISIHAENDYWACMEITVTSDDDNTCTEPELEDDPNCVENNADELDGELGGLINFVWWVDDGDNVLEHNETPFIEPSSALEALNQSIILADSSENLFEEEGPLLAENIYYIGKAWCFGDLTTSPLTQDESSNSWSPADDNDGNETAGEPEDGGFTCDGTFLDNASQTDSLLGDVSFAAYQARHNDNFLCNPFECEPQEVWADIVVSSTQGLRKNGTAITDPNRTDPNEALGPADWVTGTGTNFYSLGDDGVIVVQFAELVGDLDGDDLSIHEATNGRSTYPEESALVEISLDGSTWHTVGTASSEPGGGGDGVSWFDISSTPLDNFQYVRVTDTTNFGPHTATADGFDLDAIDAQSVCSQ